MDMTEESQRMPGITKTSVGFRHYQSASKGGQHSVPQATLADSSDQELPKTSSQGSVNSAISAAICNLTNKPRD